jgi:hypothetical protein
MSSISPVAKNGILKSPADSGAFSFPLVDQLTAHLHASGHTIATGTSKALQYRRLIVILA